MGTERPVFLADLDRSYTASTDFAKKGFQVAVGFDCRRIKCRSRGCLDGLLIGDDAITFNGQRHRQHFAIDCTGIQGTRHGEGYPAFLAQVEDLVGELRYVIRIDHQDRRGTARAIHGRGRFKRRGAGRTRDDFHVDAGFRRKGFGGFFQLCGNFALGVQERDFHIRLCRRCSGGFASRRFGRHSGGGLAGTTGQQGGKQGNDQNERHPFFHVLHASSISFFVLA